MKTIPHAVEDDQGDAAVRLRGFVHHPATIHHSNPNHFDLLRLGLLCDFLGAHTQV